MNKMLGQLTLLVDYPTEDGKIGRRGIRVDLHSAPLERYAGDRRQEILALSFEALGSLLGTPVRVLVDEGHDVVRFYADPPRAEETFGDVFETCPRDTDGDGNCPVHPQGCPRMRAKTPVGEIIRGVTPGMELDDLGKKAYDAYCESSKGRSAVTGELLPLWANVRPEIKQGWIAAALAAQPTGQQHVL